jgi:hypothetical protein
MPSKIRRHLRTFLVSGRNQITGRNKRQHYIRGLLKPLKRVFYRNFKRPPHAMRNSSKKLGIRVHHEVELWALGKPVRRPHRYTKQILAALAALNLVPVDAEVPLLSFKGAFLTRSDLICSHKDANDTVVVSLKTGGSMGYTKHQGDCKHLGGLKNCVKSHHQLQLACEVACIEHEYKIPVAGAFVVYAGFGKKKTSRTDTLLPNLRTRAARNAINMALLDDAAATRAQMPHFLA